MRLGYLCQPEQVNSDYRGVIPLGALKSRGHKVVGPRDSTHDAPLRELASCELVHCYRREDRIPDLIALSRLGVAISFDNDDDLAASDMLSGKPSLAGRRQNRQISSKFAEFVRIADLVTTPSEVLAAKYRQAGAKNVVVLENHLDSAMPHFGFKERHNGIVIGWVAGLEHAVDVGPLNLVEILGRLLDSHPDLRVVTVGVRLPLRSTRYQHLAKVNHLDLLRTTATFDIGIAPLVDNPFNRARSDIKLKEYASGGAAWLASPVGPYIALGSGQGGELVKDSDWFEAIDRLVRAPRQRRRLTKKALRWAKTQTIEHHIAAWEREFQLAIERAEQRMRMGTERPAVSAR